MVSPPLLTASRTLSTASARPSRTQVTSRARTLKSQWTAQLSAEEQIKYLEELITKYPIDSIEDGLDENDWDNWVKLTAAIGDRCQLVGDDLFVTNVKFLEKGIKMGAGNSILIKVNQIGSLTETLDAIEMAHRHGYTTVTRPAQ